MKRKIYIASSWRNQHQNSVVRACKSLGHEVYDFKNPTDNNYGFSWSQVREDYLKWTPSDYVYLLLGTEDFPQNSRIKEGFKLDMDSLNWCDTCILLLPCGRSVHLEAGYCIGQKKDTAVFISNERFEPDLMYLMANLITEKIEKVY